MKRYQKGHTDDPSPKVKTPVSPELTVLACGHKDSC